MYRDFFHLIRDPFELSPDPSFMFPTPRHNEALASLYYGIRRQRGFVVLTGEVGTGKTLLIRCLLRMLPQSQVTLAYVFNPLLTPTQFLQYILSDLGLPLRVAKNEILHELNTYLIDRHQRGLTSLLVVDEAHHLSSEILEEIRLLTNLESDRKLLQILLAGQPELDDKLDSPELRQLKQRIALRCSLEPLNPKETSAYIQHRLQIAGAPHPDQLFSSAAVELIYRSSGGIPRLINTICENSLVAAFARQMGAVDLEIVDEIVRDFRLAVVTPSRQPETTPTEKAAVELLMKLLASYSSATRNSRKAGANPQEHII